MRFPMRLGRKSRPVLLLFGVREGNAFVDIDGGELDANFGFFHLRTPISNIVRYSIEGPWFWITAIGVRLAVFHRDLTYGGNHIGGVRLDFAEPVRSLINVPALYVSVEDLEGFGAALGAHGIPGVDKRKHRR